MLNAPVSDWGTALMSSVAAALALLLTGIPKLVGWYERSKQAAPRMAEASDRLQLRAEDRADKGTPRMSEAQSQVRAS
jgi:hypothetical protein